MKNSQILTMILLLATNHGMHASHEQPAELYKMEHANWYGTCSSKRCPNPFDDLMFEDNDQIQLHGGSCQEWVNHKNKDLLMPGWDDENTFLGRAVKTNNIQEVTRLIELGADVNMQDKYGDILLHWAVYENTKEITQLLLTAGAVINKQNNYGYTPLHFAATRSLYKTIQLLLDAGADVNKQNEDGDTPLHLAVATMDPIRLLITASVNGDTTTDLETLIDNAQKSIKLLIESGAKLRIKNKNGKTAKELTTNKYGTNQTILAIFNEAAVTPDNLINNSCSIS